MSLIDYTLTPEERKAIREILLQVNKLSYKVYNGIDTDNITDEDIVKAIEKIYDMLSTSAG